ncbi:unnamed protein product [Effrenium voratum]|uniref:Fucosyltransferase n=1 Tax=Effrenium voratum TaxID=2562239 RepID=A0AA36IQS5_9DINO|nr:unnamed protein product [Effrenium voratum]CAJ1422638.1 unnamed protein product [Effrenium voratum]
MGKLMVHPYLQPIRLEAWVPKRGCAAGRNTSLPRGQRFAHGMCDSERGRWRVLGALVLTLGSFLILGANLQDPRSLRLPALSASLTAVDAPAGYEGEEEVASNVSVNVSAPEKPLGRPKLIFVNCIEDGKAVRTGKWKNKGLVCPRGACNFTVRTKDLEKADAVVFNALWMSPLSKPPSRKRRGQVWVYSFHFESPTLHTRARGVTGALSKNMDLTMTFQPSSDIFRPFYRLVRHSDPEAYVGFKADGAYAKGKKYLLLWFVGNCGAKGRMSLFKDIQKILGDKVHMFGRCGKKSPCKGNRDTPCNVELMSQYKFYAAFENSRCQGYVTEKFFRGLRWGMVPLALGGLGRKDYERILPGTSFLHVDDFRSVQDLAKELLAIDADDARYNRFHDWRAELRVSGQGEAQEAAYCELCEALHQGDQQKLHPPKRSFGSNLESWMFQSCAKDVPRWAA